MVDKRGGVFLCLYGHGEFYGTRCPACDDGLPPHYLPVRTFEYALDHYGGNYADAGETVLIPEDLIADGREEETFESFCGLHRCHIVNVRSEEEGALEGEELAERIEVLEEQQSTLQQVRKQHYENCPICLQCRLRPAEEEPV